MKLLAIDPGTTECGLVFGEYDEDYKTSFVILPETWKFKGSREERLNKFLWRFTAYIDTYEIDTVVYERPFARGRDATRCLWGQAGIIEAVASSKAAVLDVSNGEVKKWVLGKCPPKRDKTPSILAAETMFKMEGLDEHQADALCIWAYAADKIQAGEERDK